MKAAQFDRIVKPVMVLVFVLAIFSAAVVAVGMWTNVYEDKAVYGTVASVDGGTVTLTDGKVYATPVDNLSAYCPPGSSIRVESGEPVVVWCNGNFLNANMIDGIG